MNDAERAYLRASARHDLARHAYDRMNGVYVYAVAEELTAARVELLAAADAMLEWTDE